MALPSDHHIDEANLCPTGKALLLKKEEIITEWIDRVRNEIPEAAPLSEPIIVDTIPSLLDNFAEVLSPKCTRRSAVQGTTIAEEHGGERARLTRYRPDHVIREYQILRNVMIEELEKTEPLSREELDQIHISFNEATREAAANYVLTQNRIREQFVATLSHDIRNPLGTATMAAQLIASQPSGNEVPFLAERILDNLRRVDRMVQDIINATYVQMGGRLNLEISEFDILEIVQSVVRNMRLSHGHRFTISSHEPIRGFWSREHLARALENLLTNAVKYGQFDGSIDIKTTLTHERMTLSVYNDGMPIPVEEQEAIFQTFRRAKDSESRKPEGWGLGLPFVRAVAESHGGSVAIDSAPGRGTTFVIDIPRDARPFQNPI